MSFLHSEKVKITKLPIQSFIQQRSKGGEYLIGIRYSVSTKDTFPKKLKTYRFRLDCKFNELSLYYWGSSFFIWARNCSGELFSNFLKARKKVE